MTYNLLSEVEDIYAKRRKAKFPFEKEIALFRLKLWSLNPKDGPWASTAAQIIAAIISLHRRDAKGRMIAGDIKTLDEFQKRFNERWYHEFYASHFVQNRINFETLFVAYHTKHDFESFCDDLRVKFSIAIDMIDYLIRAAKFHKEMATRGAAERFISLNAYGRTNNYGISIGEMKRKQARKEPISPVTITKRWDKAPNTLGVLYVMSKGFKELEAVDVTKPDVLRRLTQLANDDQTIRRFLGHYRWLVEYCEEKLPQLRIYNKWPRLSHDFESVPLPLMPFTSEQQSLIAKYKRSALPAPAAPDAAPILS